MKIFSKYLNPIRYISRINILLNKYAFCHIENLVNKGKSEIQFPPVFVVGPPRSGSTLTIQLIVDAFDIGYLTNRHAKFFGAPFLIEKYFNPGNRRPSGNYSSTHGRTIGPYSPSEAGVWRYRFFRREPPYVTLDDVDPKKMLKFRKSVSQLIGAAQKPFIFKNMHETVRIQPIKKYIPESLFIVLHRNEIDNAHSLLETRLKVYGEYQTWWSVKTPQSESLKSCTPGKQVIEQVRGLHKIVKDDFEKMNVKPDEVLHINYEKLCDNPQVILNEIQEFFLKNGVRLKRRKNSIPDRFKRRENIRIDPDIYNEMINYAKNG